VQSRFAIVWNRLGSLATAYVAINSTDSNIKLDVPTTPLDKKDATSIYCPLFQRERDCTDYHEHEGTTAKIHLFPDSVIGKRLRLEAYLGRFFVDDGPPDDPDRDKRPAALGAQWRNHPDYWFPRLPLKTATSRCRSQTEKKYFRGSFQLLSQFKTYQPSGNLKFNNLGFSKSLKLRILMGKSPSNFSKAKFHSKYFGRLWVKITTTTVPGLTYWTLLCQSLSSWARREEFTVFPIRLELALVSIRLDSSYCFSGSAGPFYKGIFRRMRRF